MFNQDYNDLLRLLSDRTKDKLDLELLKEFDESEG